MRRGNNSEEVSPSTHHVSHTEKRFMLNLGLVVGRRILSSTILPPPPLLFFFFLSSMSVLLFHGRSLPKKFPSPMHKKPTQQQRKICFLFLGARKEQNGRRRTQKIWENSFFYKMHSSPFGRRRCNNCIWSYSLPCILCMFIPSFPSSSSCNFLFCTEHQKDRQFSLECRVQEVTRLRECRL